MKNNQSSISFMLSLKKLLSLAILASLTLPSMGFAANVLLAKKPLVESSTSDALPNLMFILDNSGSMGWNYLPDWVATYDNFDSGLQAITFTKPILSRNSVFNTQFYNPNINYTPAVDYAGTSMGSQAAPWTSVNNNAFKPSDGQTNLVGNAKYYAFVAGEYCTTVNLTNCTTATAPTGAFQFAAPIRWCNTSANAIAMAPAAGACQATRITGFTNLRAPSAITTLTFGGGGGGNTDVTSIKVNGKEILSSTRSENSSSTMAQVVRDKINDCTNNITGNCQINGYSASRSGSTVTIFSAWGSASVPFVPVVTKSAGSITVAAPTAMTLRTPGSLAYVNIVSTTPTYAQPGSAAKGSERADCAGAVCTYNEEMTNYANWYTYYRTRMQGMKTSVSLAFKPIDGRYRVGFFTINNSSTNYLPIAKFEVGAGNQKQLWYNKLFGIVPGSGTPLRSALTTVGRIYAHKMPGYLANDPIEYACSKNFTLLTTDGYWNTDADSAVKNVLGVGIGNLDGGATPRPLYEGATASSANLADAAKYYYDTDIRTTAFGNCTGALGQNVCGEGAAEVAFSKQNITTLTLGLGIDGTVMYSSDYKTQNTAVDGDFGAIKAGSKDWPVPVADTEKAIDDLWHAAVNANGTYFSAKNPKQLTDSLKKALSEIQSKAGAGSAAAASSLQPTAGDNYNYVASYATVKWTGNLEAREVDLTTFVTSPDATWCVSDVAASPCIAPASLVLESSVFSCKTTSSDAPGCTALGGVLTGTDCRVAVGTSCVGTLATRVAAATDTRVIKFNSGGSLVDFNYANLPAAQKPFFETAWLSGNLSQWAGLTSGAGSQQERAVGDGLVNYLRGQQGLENRGSNIAANRIFRFREATLGDITESQPAYIAKPIYRYTDADYAAFKVAHATRAGTIYVGANDGMLHAIRASDGQELWAFVPTPVISKMWKLADEDYATNHVNLVNGDPVISDICISGCAGAGAVWRTVLVSGLSGGGRGYYALDITDPGSPALLWEFTAQDNANLGYTFGTPVITKLNSGAWVVLLTSGYNNGTKDNDGVTNNSPVGDGQGYLFVLNANTGAVIKTFNTGVGSAGTPSGLAQIGSFADSPMKNNLSTYVYGGDLSGNLWRFDINSVAAPFKLATLVGPGGLPQPITTVPQLGVINKKRVIFVGTGKYLEVADLSNIEVQSLYAIKDDNLSIPLGDPRPSLVQQTISSSGATRTVATTAAVDFSAGLGWRIDFPDAGERTNIDPFLVNGVLLAPTIVPASTSCSPGGYGWFNYFNYKTGGALPVSAGVVSQYLVAPAVGFNLVYDVNGKPTVTVVEADNPTPHVLGIPLSSGGNRSTLFDVNPDGSYGKKSIWRELTR